MKLSVIIPVYGVEATLDRCLESVAAQTFADMEIILVDDGSPDRCPAMCDAWAEKDPRIRVIHKENGGLSDARNAALDIAKGEYVTFVDSDDYLHTGTYAEVMALTGGTTPQGDDCRGGSDITEFPVLRHCGLPSQQEVHFGTCVYDSAEDYWLRARAYEHSYACNKIYRRKLFSSVRFPKGKVFEDVFTLPKLLMQARRIATVEAGMYYYCLNDKGITVTAGGQQLQMLLDAHQEAMRHWCDDRYYMHVLNIQSDVCEQTGLPPTLPRRRVSPLAKGLSPSQRMKALALLALGMDNTCKLNKTLHQWKSPSHS